MKSNAQPSDSAAIPARDPQDEVELSGRDRYLLEAQRIRDEIGDLQQILETLGINQRRACQLLLVDPSAWTRWNKTGVPPHIYQALRWLIELKKIKPSITGPVDMGSRLDRIQLSTQTKLKELEQGLAMVERALTFTPASGGSVEIAETLQAATAMQKALLEERRENLKKISDLEDKLRELTADRPQRGLKSAARKKRVQTKPSRNKARPEKEPMKKAKKKLKQILAAKRSRPKKQALRNGQPKVRLAKRATKKVSPKTKIKTAAKTTAINVTKAPAKKKSASRDKKSPRKNAKAS